MKRPPRYAARDGAAPPVPPSAGSGAQQVIAAIKAQPAPGTDPNELLAMEAEQLEVVRETGVGRAFGVESGLLSRGGRTAKLTLGGGRVVVIEAEED